MALQSFDGYLYAGFHNTADGGEIWRSQTGASGSWSQVNQNGFGRNTVDDPNNGHIRSLGVWDKHLYAGTINATTGGEVWRTDTGGQQEDWKQVNTDGFGWEDNDSIMTLLGFGDHIYAGTDNGSNGTEVWRTGLPGAAEARFAQVINASLRTDQASTIEVTGASNWSYSAPARGIYAIPLPDAGIYTISCGCGESISVYVDTATGPQLDHFTFDTIANQTTDYAFPITLQAWAYSGETTTIAITGTLMLTDSTGTIAPASTVVTNASSISLDVTIGVSQTNVVITPSFGSLVGHLSNPFTVTDFTHFDWDMISSPQHLNVPFAASIHARNGLGEVISGYTGTANLSASVSGGVFTPTVATFMDGAASFDAKMGFTGTDVVLTATHPTVSSIVGASSPFTVTADSATQYAYLPLVLR
jgi:hypothetical protein